MNKKRFVRYLTLLIVLVMIFASTCVSAMAVTVTGVSGVEVTCDSNGSISESGGTVTVKATGSFTTRKATEITIKNTSGSTATISFDISTSNVDAGESTIDDLEGKFSQNLAANQSVTYTLCSKRYQSNNTGVATLSNFKVTVASTKYAMNLSYDTGHGSVTIDGTTAAPGTHQIAAATLKATAKSGASFLGWINPVTREVFSTDSTYNVVMTEAMSIEAAFAGSNAAWFYSEGKTHLFANLTDANTYASGAAQKTIILANNGTLSGSHTISAGVTMLIPYNDANTLCTTAPSVHDDSYTAPSVYRTLTMESGANITVNGAISVSGSQSSKYAYNGMPSGPLGFIHMNSGSTITINNGANLYAWGYIKGSGSVTVNSGGTVHECFQIADYRGGDATSNIAGKDDEYGVFPFNQYYIQNVEVPMTLYAGAKENGYGSVSVTLMGTQKLSIPFIGASDSMFIIDSGYIVKDYIEGSGRTEIKIYGGLSVTEVSIAMKVAMLGSLTINTAKYALPIPHHMTISMESGSINMNQSIAFLPGSELYIKQGTMCTLGSGKKIYFYDLDEWLYNGGANGYSGTTNKPYVKIPYVPGGDGTTGRLKDALVQIDGTLDASAGSVYVTSGIANAYSTGTGVVKLGSATDTVAYQVITADTSISSWPEIAMQPIILQDADGTDVATKENAGTYTYCADTGKWCTPDHRSGEGVITAPTCTTEGYTTYTCIACGESYTGDEIPATGHSYGDPTYTWADDGSSCTASHACSCGTTETETATINNEQSKAPTCIAKGETTYTAEFNADWATTQTKTIADIDMIAHADAENDGNHICDTEGCSKVVTSCSGGTATCSVQATCEECGQPYGEKDTDNHTGNTYTDNVKAETCGEEGYTGDEVCECGVTINKGAPISATGNHSYGDWVVTKEPTTTEPGSRSRTCSICSDVDTEGIPMVEVTGIKVNFINYTAEGGDLATVTIDGTAVAYAEKTAVEATLGIDGTFTVSCAKACVVIVVTEGDDGTKTYNTLLAKEPENENAYEFIATDLSGDVEIIVALKGDVNEDGKLNVRDRLAVAKGILSSSNENHENMTELQQKIGDVNGDDKLNVRDRLAIAKGILSSSNSNYAMITW